MSFFTNMKDKLNILGKSNLVYHFSCPSCEFSHIGKSERTLFERTKEHIICENPAIKGHLDNCSNVEHLFYINNLMLNDVNTHEFTLSLVRQNTRIIDQSYNWNVLLLKEAYHKEKCPILNNGVKASRKMQFF